MKESIENILYKLERILRLDFVINVRIIEATKSVLIFNEKRIFGKDFVFGKWHRHPFENPDEHDESKIAQQAVTIDEFIKESFYVASEKLKII